MGNNGSSKWVTKPIKKRKKNKNEWVTKLLNFQILRRKKEGDSTCFGNKILSLLHPSHIFKLSFFKGFL